MISEQQTKNYVLRNPRICLEQLRNRMKNLSKYYGSSDRDLNRDLVNKRYDNFQFVIRNF